LKRKERRRGPQPAPVITTGGLVEIEQARRKTGQETTSEPRVNSRHNTAAEQGKLRSLGGT